MSEDAVKANVKFFTFQSGDIQIKDFFCIFDFTFNFTFQSGDIQIRPILFRFLLEIFLYIPIW